MIKKRRKLNMSNKYPGRLIREGEQDKKIVSAIQKRLIEVGCGVTDLNKDGRPETLAVDGNYGPQTSEAVATFQAKFDDLQGRRLLVDGAVGANTWGALFGEKSVPTVEKPDSDLLAKVLDKARSQIGQSEKPPGSNGGGMVKQYLGAVGLDEGFPWCAAFLYWCFREVEGEGTRCVRTAGVLDHWARAGQQGVRRIGFQQARENPSLIKPGMIFIMDTGPAGGAGHTGIVDRIEGGTLVTIEGNTNEAGSREGTAVLRKTTRRVSSDSINKGFIDYGV
jgi:hypothetical protein